MRISVPPSLFARSCLILLLGLRGVGHRNAAGNCPALLFHANYIGARRAANAAIMPSTRIQIVSRLPRNASEART